jgi:YgiT-type zinc finger domain-containing protein
MGTWIYDQEEKMNCVICKEGHTKPGLTSITLEREGMILIVKGVPADICTNCGEAYVGSDVTREILKLAKIAQSTGVQLEICSFKVA